MVVMIMRNVTPLQAVSRASGRRGEESSSRDVSAKHGA
jgi:hypothetical protein